MSQAIEKMVDPPTLARQLLHTTVTAWPNERSTMAAPHFGQFSAFDCGFGGPESGGVTALITTPQNCGDF